MSGSSACRTAAGWGNDCDTEASEQTPAINTNVDEVSLNLVVRDKKHNPILDLNGKPFKVVKYATDVTAQALSRLKTERARGFIESVAAGSEEMNASIREISQTMVKSKETA